MTDTMIFQNIDLSSWDTLYKRPSTLILKVCLPIVSRLI
jgi:hypothetical protein